MDNAKRNEKALFDAARELTDAAQRRAFLDQACAGEPELRQRMEELLAGQAQADQFFAQGAAALQPPTTVQLPVTEKPGDRIGRYKLLEKIGEGGCGVVYVADQEEPVRRRVALKVIKLGMDTKSVVARFEAERQALAMMDHPNIAKVLDAGATETGRPYFVMELVRGIKLTDYCDQNELPTRQRLDLFIKICQAVQHAHQKGIIHRDLKPSNILVTLHDGVPVPKVIDFGIAKATEGRLTDLTVYTELHQFIGTPAYMSPEQAEMSGLDIDTRSDIYSLGVLLYELLTGCTPFDAKELLASGLDAMRRTIRENDPLRPSTRLHSLSEVEQTTTARRRGLDVQKLMHLLRGDLDCIVMRCLEKDRTRRYDTANGLGADLKRFLASEPVLARAPSAAYRFQKAFRRNRLAITAAGAIVLALLLGAIAASWQAVRATKAEREQVALRAEAERAAVRESTSRKAAEAATAQEVEQRQRAESGEQQAQRLLYVANINLAQLAWDQNNMAFLRRLLDDTASYPDRGFEWYYWRRQTRRDLHSLRGHLAALQSAAISADGRRVVTACMDGTAKVWDAVDGRELVTLRGHGDAVMSVAISSDARRIVTGSADWTAKVWETSDGKELFTFRGHSGVLSSVAISPDGQRVLTSDQRGGVKVWDLATGREMLTLTGNGRGVYCVAFSRDGQRIVGGASGETAKAWNSVTGQELVTVTLKGIGPGLHSMVFSPDESRIAVINWGTAKVWDAATGQELFTLKGHGNRVFSVDFSPDGRRIVTASQDRTAKVWDAATGRELFTLKGHAEGIMSAAFSLNGERIVTAGQDRTAKVWDATAGHEPLSLRGEPGVSSLAFTPDSHRIIAGMLDGTVKVWDVTSGQEFLRLRVHGNDFWGVASSPDGKRLATVSSNKTAKVWNALTGQELLSLQGHRSRLRCVAFSPDGGRLVTASEDATAKVWNATTGHELLTLQGHGEAVWSAAFSPDGQRIVTGSSDGTAKVWEAATGKVLLSLRPHKDGVWAAAFSPDGRRIVTGNQQNGTANVWDAASGREIAALKGDGDRVWSVAFSPDGSRVAVTSSDGSAKLWDPATGRELLTMKGHSADVLAVAFSPDGHRLVTGGSWGDATAKVWEAATVEQVIAWEEQEKAAAERLDALRREQAAEEERQRKRRQQDPGAIKKWLVLAPIALTVTNSANALAEEPVSWETLERARAGQRVKVHERELTWQDVRLDDYSIDFNRLRGGGTEFSVAYAVCYLRSESERAGLVLKLASSDPAKVLLNGAEVGRQVRHGNYFDNGPLEDVAAGVSLRAGMNTLVLMVTNDDDGWHEGRVWLTMPGGELVPGLEVTLDPESKGAP